MDADPVCGMYVDESTAELKAQVRGVTYYFCSESCMREFLAPERELRKLKVELGADACSRFQRAKTPSFFLLELPVFGKKRFSEDSLPAA